MAPRPFHATVISLIVLLLGQTSLCCFRAPQNEPPELSMTTTTAVPSTTESSTTTTEMPTTTTSPPTTTTSTTTTTTTPTTTTTMCLKRGYDIIIGTQLEETNTFVDHMAELMSHFDLGSGYGEARFGYRLAANPDDGIRLEDFVSPEQFIRDLGTKVAKKVFGDVDAGKLLGEIVYHDFGKAVKRNVPVKKIALLHVRSQTDFRNKANWEAAGDYARREDIDTYVVYSDSVAQADALKLTGSRSEFLHHVPVYWNSWRKAVGNIAKSILNGDPCRMMKKVD